MAIHYEREDLSSRSLFKNLSKKLMSLIPIEEYENLYIDEGVSTRKSITSEQAEILTNLKSTYGIEVFKYINKNTIRAQQYVGVIQVGNNTIEVLPKIAGNNTRRNLVAMLSVAPISLPVLHLRRSNFQEGTGTDSPRGVVDV
jgi:5-methylcytosine-specific restriction endonuclease McrBC regulatory subunit McrC